MKRQTKARVELLTSQLEVEDLNKAERLQILNLGPKSVVEMVVVSPPTHHSANWLS